MNPDTRRLRDLAREDVRVLPSQPIPDIVKTDTGLSARIR